MLRARITASIALGKEVNLGTDTGHTKIDITRTRVILDPMNSTLTALLNNAAHTSNESIYNGYGITGWRALYWKNISISEDAKTNFKINQVIPDIFQISKKMVDGTTHKVLKLGAQGGNADSDNRPISLAGSITAIKQQKTTPTQTAQAAVLIGKWTYPCRIAKGHSYYPQRKSLDFEGNKLITVIDFYGISITTQLCADHATLLYKVKIEDNIVQGKVINKGAANEHTQIGIKTTKVEIKLEPGYIFTSNSKFNKDNFYNTRITDIYNGYGLTDWQQDKWKDISSAPNAIENLNIGTQVPDIFNISTVTTDKGSHKVLKMGDYQGNFDINGRAMSLEPEGAVFQPK